METQLSLVTQHERSYVLLISCGYVLYKCIDIGGWGSLDNHHSDMERAGSPVTSHPQAPYTSISNCCRLSNSTRVSQQQITEN